MSFRPYLAFKGNCRSAFTRYQEIFGGEIFVMTMADMPAEAEPNPEGTNPDAVMHAALTIGDDLLMGADDPMGHFDGNVSGMCVTYSTTDPTEAGRVFAALADGGTTQVPISETFFSPAFGMCTGSPVVGEQTALNVITAVLLGGTSLAGGSGSIWGSIAGLLAVGVLENVMGLFDVPAYWQRILQGGLLLAIIIADRVAGLDLRRRWGRFRLAGRAGGSEGDST